MRQRDGSGANRCLREGLSAGLTLAVLDALATGVHRIPFELHAVILAFGLGAGLAAGFVALRTGRPGHAFALVVAFGAGLNSVSLASKHLSGTAQLTLAVAGVVFALTAGVVARGLHSERRHGFGTGVFILASIPAASLVAYSLDFKTSGVAVAVLVPFVATLLARALGTHLAGPRGLVVAVLIAILSALPTAIGDRVVARPDRGPSGASAAADAPDVVLVIVDTLRNDAVPAGGLFERVASEGVRFEQCISTAPWTLPAVASIFTSLLPSQHGALDATRALPEDVATLAESFHGAGYETAAFTGGAFVGPAFRLDQGFEHFDSSSELGFQPFRIHVPLAWRLVKNRYLPLRSVARWVDEYPGISGLRSSASEWLQSRDRSRPLFLVIHTYEAHDYYISHPRIDDARVLDMAPLSDQFRGRMSVHPAELVSASQSDLDWFHAIYTARIAHVEHELEALLDAFDRSAERERVLAIMSDHGEGFDAARQRVHHGGRLHDDLLHVPLLLHAPGRLPAGVVVTDQVRTIDVMPTLLALAQLESPGGIGGTSLVDVTRGASDWALDAWSEERANGRDLVSLRSAGWKLVDESGVVRAFELRTDPGEDEPTTLPANLIELGERMRSFSELFPSRATSESMADEATLAHLRNLGYVD